MNTSGAAVYRAALIAAAEYVAALRVADAPDRVQGEAVETLTLVYLTHKDREAERSADLARFHTTDPDSG